MNRLNDLEYLRLNAFGKFLYKIRCFILSIPQLLLKLLKAIWRGIKWVGISIKDEVLDIFHTFTKGSWATKVSFFIMGFGNLFRGQIFRGVIFLLFQAVFAIYMIVSGAHWLGKFGTLGDTVSETNRYDPVSDAYVRVPGDDSFKILLYGLMTLLFIIALLYTWRLNVKQNRINDSLLRSGKRLKSGKDDLKSLLDDQFHKTMLALPISGIIIFTIMPIIFMVLVAFTNYDGAHDGYSNLFTWVGLNNFNQLFNVGTGGATGFSYTFGEILSWTLIWAIFATFTNYFLGMFVAIMINKKGIKIKKVWRGILVLTIAIPQFVSLLYVSKLFAYNGLVNGVLLDLGVISKAIHFWDNTNAIVPRILVIIINIWIGIPYLMLISTGILMNIPQDLYESAKIDGANVFQQYMRITLPYMLFVTGPYLLTSFINNLNNFNVIYLLTWGHAVPIGDLPVVDGLAANQLDLLITWLFKLTAGDTGAVANYKLSAVIGIMIFVVVATLSMIVYNIIPSTRNEEDYA